MLARFTVAVRPRAAQHRRKHSFHTHTGISVERNRAAGPSLPMSAAKTPSEFLKGVLGRPVVVKLNSGVEYRGTEDAGAALAPGARLRAPRAAVPPR